MNLKKFKAKKTEFYKIILFHAETCVRNYLFSSFSNYRNLGNMQELQKIKYRITRVIIRGVIYHKDFLSVWKKLYFDYIQPILDTFIRYNYKAQRQGNIRSERVRVGFFFAFYKLKLIQSSQRIKINTLNILPPRIKDWSVCITNVTARLDPIRQRLVAGSRGLHFLDYTHCENAVNLWLEIFL